MAKFYEEYSFDTAPEFLKAFTPWASSSSFDGYIFRGHADDRFTLVPSALRPEEKDRFWARSPLGKPIANQSEWPSWQAEAERHLIREFYRLADARGLNVPTSPEVRLNLAQTVDWGTSRLHWSPYSWIPDDLLEATALAQHYGIPTRLLDWTYDPFVALFFAADSEISDADFLSVWCLNHDHLSFLNGTVVASAVRFIRPHYAGNPNLAAQSGLFSHWCTVIDRSDEIHGPGPERTVNRSPLDQLLRNHYAPTGNEVDANIFKKFLLPASQKWHLKHLLCKAGFDRPRIYPGYASVAQEILNRNGVAARIA